jgi:monofunctional biosynthetic peptidoglycan transglycosylase
LVVRARSVLRALSVLAAAAFALLAYVYLTLPDVRPLRTENPTTTAWMELRAREARAEGRTLRHEHRWVPYGRISQQLKRAVIVTEDSAFFEHEGVDLEQIRESMEVNLEQGRAARGGSTITQQLAKNLYLSPSRNPIRKLRELIIARRLEAALSKARILEIYLNVIEWGDGVWGAEAASRRYFGVSAGSLSSSQAALLAGAIINPRLLNPAHPTPRLLRRQRIIMRRMGGVTPPVPVPASAPVVADTPSPEDVPPPEPAIPPVVVDPVPAEPPPPDAVPAKPKPPVPCPVPPCTSGDSREEVGTTRENSSVKAPAASADDLD